MKWEREWGGGGAKGRQEKEVEGVGDRLQAQLKSERWRQKQREGVGGRGGISL